MIYLSSFLRGVRKNVNRIHAYELGHDGSDGKSDCIGLIIGALKLAGGKLPGVHGSNWAARNAMATLEHIADTREMFLGEIVYKAKEPGEEGYDLPAAYKNSPDQRDYYHVGVVTGVDPLEITHCTSVEGGIKFDTQIGKWRWGGRLKYVNYDEGEMPMEPIYQATVHADNDYPVKMREQASTKSEVLAKIPQGTIVDVLGIVGSNEGDWGFIRYGDQNGYMMMKFLESVKEEETDEDIAELRDILAEFEKATMELKAYMEAHQ